MGLRVAIVLDGTVADLSRAMHDVAKKKFRKLQQPDASAPVDDVDSALLMERPRLRDLGLSAADLDRLWKHVLRQRNFWTTLDEMTDVPRALRAALAAARGYRYLQVDASDDSRPILERLGFVALGTTTPFIHRINPDGRNRDAS
mgnify:CR=1 FL=1